jgi:geranylgeranyl pyrophosphate synthase
LLIPVVQFEKEPMLARNEKIEAVAARSQPWGVELGRPPNGLLGENKNLTKLLGLKSGASLEDIIQIALMNPVKDVTSNRGKRIRGKLVALSYRLLAKGSTPSRVETVQCRTCAEVVESIHAGSLVVDDIEDGSTIRRGKPALHIRYGLPTALNAGNWLYFWPTQLIKGLELPSKTALSVYECYHRTLLRAHFGQAMDLGSRVDRLLQNRVPDVCLATMELKTGALMGFAMMLGAAVAGAAEAAASLVDEFGRDLGIALQMFDDLGNVLGIREPAKKYEDLVLYRPSWAWGCAARASTPQNYEQFVAAVGKLPDARELENWIDKHRLIQRMRESARHRLECTFNHLKIGLESRHVRWSVRALDEIREVGEEIALAYD